MYLQGCWETPCLHYKRSPDLKSSFIFSLPSVPNLTSTYPVISHKIKCTYWWLRTVKLHILLAAHLNPTPNDVNGRTCFSQVAEDIGSRTTFLFAFFAFNISHPLFCWCWFPHSVFDLVCNLGTQLSVPLPFPVRSFHLTADKVAQIYRGSSLPYQTTSQKTRTIHNPFLMLLWGSCG